MPFTAASALLTLAMVATKSLSFLQGAERADQQYLCHGYVFLALPARQDAEEQKIGSYNTATKMAKEFVFTGKKRVCTLTDQRCLSGYFNV